MNSIRENGPSRITPNSNNRFTIRRHTAMRTRAPLTWRRVDEDRLSATWFVSNRIG